MNLQCSPTFGTQMFSGMISNEIFSKYEAHFYQVSVNFAKIENMKIYWKMNLTDRANFYKRE